MNKTISFNKSTYSIEPRITPCGNEYFILVNSDGENAYIVSEPPGHADLWVASSLGSELEVLLRRTFEGDFEVAA